MIGAVVLLHAVLLGGPYAPQMAQSWDEMSPRQRYDAMRNYQQHQNLPADQQRDMEQRYQRWQQMPEQERDRIRQNFQRYQALPQDQRDDFQRRYERWKQTPRP
jgi:hypothetical protein